MFNQINIHLLVSIPPEVSISELMGILKGRLAIKPFKSYPQLKHKPCGGNHFWSRGYFVNTVGLNQEMIRRHVHHQEEQDKKEEKNGQHFGLFDQVHITSMGAEGHAFTFSTNPPPLGRVFNAALKMEK